MGSRGFLIIATGDDYIEEAKTTAKSIEQHSNHPIALISDREVNSKLFDEVIIDEDPTYSFFDKPRNIGKTPFDETVFIDTDAHLVSQVPELFEILDQVDIATTIDPNEWGGRMRKDSHFDDISEAVPIFQTGVICYKKEACGKLFRLWKRIHKENQDSLTTDQSSFRLAIYQLEINHLALSDLYNCLGTWPMQVTGEVKIIHKGADDEFEARDLATRMNTTNEPRLFYYPTRGNIYCPTNANLNSLALVLSKKLIYVSSTLKLLELFYSSCQRRGLIETIRRSIRQLISK